MTTQGQPSPPAADLVFVGVVTGARGLQGEVRVRSFTGDPAAIAAYGPLCDETGGQPLQIRVTGRSKDQVVVRVEGVEDRNAAEDLKGRRLFVPRAALPEPDGEEFYHIDLIGLRAERSDGEILGTVRAVHDFGAGDVLEIAGDEGASIMVSFTHATVPKVDLADGRVVVDPPSELQAENQEDGTEQ